MSIYEKYYNAKNKIKSVYKNAKNAHNGAKYASLSNMLSEINPVLNECGLIVNFSKITLNLEHTHLYDFSVEIIDKDNPKDVISHLFQIPYDTTQRNPVQGFGATMTYGQRYIYAILFNIALDDEDPDSKKDEYNSQKQSKKEIQRRDFVPRETDKQYYDKNLNSIFEENADLKAKVKMKNLTSLADMRLIFDAVGKDKQKFIALLNSEDYKDVFAIKEFLNV